MTKLASIEDGGQFITYWTHRSIPLGTKVTYRIDGIAYMGPVVLCDWDSTYKPPQYEVTFKVIE